MGVTLYFSEEFRITRGEGDDWFDPLLDEDLPFFIDPFLVFAGAHAFFGDAHSKVMGYFNRVYEIAASTERREGVPGYRKVLLALEFPEVDELCLGYSEGSTKGAGLGDGFGRLMRSAVFEAIAAGLRDIERFEEIALLEVGIGRDRISDAMANLLKPELVAYTQDVCTRHGIEMSEVTLNHVLVDEQRLIWRPQKVTLPINPACGQALLLVPERFLGQMIAINSGSFGDFFYDTADVDLRAEFDVEVKANLDKAKIVEIARRVPQYIRKFVEYVETAVKPKPYDFVADPDGTYLWEKRASEHVASHPLELGGLDSESFKRFVESMVESFKTYVEMNRGYKLLYNEGRDGRLTPKKEEALQLLFFGVVKLHCRDNGVVVTREAETGRGPIDFKFSNGYTRRAYIEVKRSGNGRLTHGLRKQLPEYMAAEDGDFGYFLVAVQDAKDEDRVNAAADLVSAVRAETGFDIRMVRIDAMTDKPSASRIP